MQAAGVEQLRVRITRIRAQHPEYSVAAIARAAGCSRTTVYRTLGDPGPDARRTAIHPRRTASDVVATIRAAATDGHSTDQLVDLVAERHGADAAPSRSTVARIAAEARRDVGAYDDLRVPGYERAAAANPDDLAGEIALARAMARELAGQLDGAPGATRKALERRLIKLLELLGKLRKADQGHPASTPLDDLLADVAEQIIRGGQL